MGDEVGAFRDAHEDVRRNAAEFRTVPARERFEGDGLAARDVENRLEGEGELSFQIRVAQASLDRCELPDLDFVFPREDDGAPANMLLGVIERIVGAFEQRLRRRPGLGKGGEADRAGDLQR